ncbi:hypothetical protein ACYCFC_13480 [Stutzerimonas sp. NM35]
MSRRKHQSTRRAILVLESPWALDKSDCYRASVLPFVEGIAKLAEETDVYHANFYDKKSFKQALESLCTVKFSNAIVYVAAHGDPKSVGGVPIANVLFEIGDAAAKNGITGVMLGTCFTGGNATLTEVFMEGTGIRWAAGYSSSCNWLQGTMIDCSVISSMLDLDDFSKREKIIESLSYAISPFSESYEIGTDINEEYPIQLRDSLEFVVQPTGSGNRAKQSTDEIFEHCEDWRTATEEEYS